MESPVINHELPVKQEDDEDEDAAWAKFNPMKDEFENVTENSYMKDSVGGTLPRKLYYGRKNPGEPKEVKLYVSKIPKHITESGLRNIFAKHGNVLYVHLVSKKDQSYRYGFVSLSNIIEADRAIQGLNHKPPFNLHIEFEMSEQDKNERVLVENCIPALLKMDFNHTEDPLYEHDADYTIKEKVLFSPGLPLEGLDWNQFPSCADALEEYHLYDLLPQCTQLYEPYLVWDASNVDDVRHALALRSYIAVDHWIGSPDQFNRVSIVIVECSRLPHSCVVVAWSMMISCASINIGLCIRLNVWIKNQVEIALIPLQIQEMSIVKRRMISPKLSKNSKHSTPATGQWWIIV
uniref:RRM domain-containing protein n=1 Tax=Cacopsylla melanoneura TaxID=428564 RepID=A0A8D8YC15_9HEMI